MADLPENGNLRFILIDFYSDPLEGDQMADRFLP